MHTEKTDPLAENAARNTLADVLREQSTMDLSEDGTGDSDENARALADLVTDQHVVTWERAVNVDDGAGPTRGTPEDPDVYVRRYRMVSAWEVDPEGKRIHAELWARTQARLAATRPQRGDTVHFRDRRDNGRGWEVESVVTSERTGATWATLTSGDLPATTANVLDLDIVGVTTPACTEPTCPDFGSTDFGEGTCPAEHALERPTPNADGWQRSDATAGELVDAVSEGYREALHAVREALTINDAKPLVSYKQVHAVVAEVARRLGVTL